MGPTNLGKGTKIMAIAAVTSLPLAVTVDSASPHETEFVEETLAGSFLDELPARLIGDRAYDSDPLDRRLKRDCGLELIAPNRENRSQTQDGRKLRRYKRRWCVERLLAWLQWFRRLVTRYEYRHGPPRLHENHAEVFESDYSYRSATMGSIFAARRAGR